MLVAQVFFKGGKHAFHLYMHVHKLGDNKLLSTVPVCLLQKLFPNLLATIKYAHIPNAFAADKYLQMLSQQILKYEELHSFFYPNYLMENGRVSLEIAEQIINLQENLPMYPRCFFSEKTDRVIFFTIFQIYLRKRRHILRTAKFISKERFENDYVLNRKMEQEFESLSHKNYRFIELSENEQIEYALVIDGKNELKMFVCL